MAEQPSLFSDVDRGFTLPARCAGCLVESDPRPLGELPEGWARGRSRPVDTAAGRYWCPDCQTVREAWVVHVPTGNVVTTYDSEVEANSAVVWLADNWPWYRNRLEVRRGN